MPLVLKLITGTSLSKRVSVVPDSNFCVTVYACIVVYIDIHRVLDLDPSNKRRTDPGDKFLP